MSAEARDKTPFLDGTLVLKEDVKDVVDHLLKFV
jgi:hypothetical protein